MKHAIYRTYLALLRGEHFDLGEYSDKQMERDVFNGLSLTMHHWSADRLLERALWKEYKIGWGKQFEIGITRTPSKLENKLFAIEMRKLFGDARDSLDFDENWLLQYESWHWVMMPVWEGRKIDRFRFGSYRDMKGWGL